ncbi:MAG: hypothetical protein V7606_3527 [Burkholderiales bacterium]
MIITNQRAPRIREQARGGREESISMSKLLGLCLSCVSRGIESARLRARLRALERQADYFAWQQENGAAGLADTHKRIVMVRADLQQLQ